MSRVAALLLAADAAPGAGRTEGVAAGRGQSAVPAPAARPVLGRAAQPLTKLRLVACIAVLRQREQAALLPKGIKPVLCAGDMSDRLRAGLNAVRPTRPDRLIVARGDMPAITPALLQRLVESCSDSLPSACALDAAPHLPACFPPTWFARLHNLSGDRGADTLLAQECNLIPAAPDLLRKID